MADERIDIRDQDPGEAHRSAFLRGWIAGASGTLYKTVLTRKTHANMGNLFGVIYGERSHSFMLATWYQYCDALTRTSATRELPGS